MTLFSEQDGIRIFHGDCLAVMPSLASDSVDSIVTDPPYELGFMGKSWDRSGIAYNVGVWKECLRVLKPGGHLLAFGGSRTYHRLACAIEDAGFEIRDQIQWIYGSGFPKSLDVSKAIDAAEGAEREVIGFKGTAPDIRGNSSNGNGISSEASKLKDRLPNSITFPATDAAKQWNGWGTALKPAHEPLVLARKPLIGTVAENVLTHGTGGLNVDGCRIETGTEVVALRSPNTAKPEARSGEVGSAMGISNSTAEKFRAAQNESIERTNSLGRWPANVIHDGSDEVLSRFPETTSGFMAKGTPRLMSANPNKHTYGYYDPDTVANDTFGDSGSAARFFYCAKASKEDREEGLNDLEIRSAGSVTDRKDGSDGLNSPRAGAGRTNGSRNHHPTVKPTDLMRYLVRLITPPGGTVLDLFAGSGSTGKACAHEGFKAILIEKEIEYCELAERRSRLQQPRLCFMTA